MRWHQQQQQRSEAQLPEFPLPSPGSTIGPNFSMPAPSTSIASPCMFMPMPRPSAQAAPPPAVRQPDWNWPGLSFQAPAAPSVQSAAVPMSTLSTPQWFAPAPAAQSYEPCPPLMSMAPPSTGNVPAPSAGPSSELQSSIAGLFSQVNQLRSAVPATRQEVQPSAPPVSHGAASATTNTRLYQDTCTICQTAFAPNDHVCRTRCRHVFHNLCIGELIQHAGETSFECPNCRVQTEVDHSWQFPNLTETSQQTPEPEGVESSFPWWPVPAHDESAKEEVPSYLSTTVRLADGNLGLLIDPGSYGDLCGQAWAEEAAKRAREQGYTAEFTSKTIPEASGVPEEPIHPASEESLPEYRPARPGVASVSLSSTTTEAMYASEEVEEIPDAILTAIQEGTVASFSASASRAAPPKAKPGTSQGRPGLLSNPRTSSLKGCEERHYAKAKAGALATKAAGAKAGVPGPKTPPKA